MLNWKRLFLAACLLILPATANADPHWLDGGAWRHAGGGWGGGWHGGWGWHSGGNAFGNGLANGFGLGAGAAIANGIFGSIFAPRPAPVPEAPVGPGTPEFNAYCANRYRTFDPVSGTYYGYDGLRHACEVQ